MLKKQELRLMQFVRRHAIDTEKAYHSKIAAAIAIKGQVISVGRNQSRTHPLAAKYSKHEAAIYLHAELAAIINALNHVDKKDLNKSTLYIHRVKRPDKNSTDWVDGIAKPCAGCAMAITAFGIKRVIYSTNTQHEYECS